MFLGGVVGDQLFELSLEGWSMVHVLEVEDIVCLWFLVVGIF